MEKKPQKPEYGYYFLKSQLMILAFFIGVGLCGLGAGRAFNSDFLVWVSIGVICYGCVSTLLWFLARFVIPGNRIDLAKRILRELDPPEDASVLDIGTGLGLYAIEAAKPLKTGRVIAIDVWDPERIRKLSYFHSFSRPSGHSIERAIANARLEGVGEKIAFSNMDANHLDFPGRSFDLIICAYLLGHLGTHAGAALREIQRVLKPEGKVAVVDNVRDFTYFLMSTPHLFLQSYLRGAKARRLTQSYWVSMMEQSGFQITKLRKGQGVIWMELVIRH